MRTLSTWIATLTSLVMPPLRLQAQDPSCMGPWSLTETLRLGSVGGAVTLGSVTAVEVGQNGEIYVVQALTPSVAVFSPVGRPLRTIGRAGQGPGEFLFSAVALGWWGDSLWVTDPNGVHFFSSDGRPLQRVSFSTVVTQESTTYHPHTPLADGTYLGQRRISGRTMARFFEASRLPLLRFAASGQIVDTITMVDLPTDLLIDGMTDAAHPLRISEGAASLPGVVAVPDGSAVFIVSAPTQRRPTSFELIKLAISGDTIWRRSVPYTPKPVTREHSARLRDAFGGWMSGEDGRQPFAVSPTLIEQRRRRAEEAIDFPDFHPPVREIVAGQDGSAWLLREMDEREVDRWEVYGDMGLFEGFFEVREGRSSDLPWAPRLRLLRAAKDEIWGTTVDELGVSYLHRYQVRRAC